MSICKLQVIYMRSIKLKFSATVLTLGLKAKVFENLRLCYLSESFGGNCARAPRLTAVWFGSTRAFVFNFQTIP